MVFCSFTDSFYVLFSSRFWISTLSGILFPTSSLSNGSRYSITIGSFPPKALAVLRRHLFLTFGELDSSTTSSTTCLEWISKILELIELFPSDMEILVDSWAASEPPPIMGDDQRLKVPSFKGLNSVAAGRLLFYHFGHFRLRLGSLEKFIYTGLGFIS